MSASILGQRILLLRRDRKLSQQALAEKAGISANTIARLERGDIQKIYSDNLDRLADALNVSTDYLLGLTNQPNGLFGETMLSDHQKLLEAYEAGDSATIMELTSARLRQLTEKKSGEA